MWYQENILDRSGTDQVYSAVFSHTASRDASGETGKAGTHIHQ